MHTRSARWFLIYNLQLSKYISFLGKIQLKDTAHGQNVYLK